MAANWVTISSAGSSGYTPPPDAPNITSVAASVYYGMQWNGSAFGLQGTITLPTGDANSSHLKEIVISAALPDGTNPAVQTLYSSAFSGSTITFKGPCNLPMLGATQSVTITFRVKNEAGVATASPVTATVTVAASAVTAGFSASDSGTRTVDGSRLMYGVINFNPQLNAGIYPQNVTSWLPSVKDPSKYSPVGWAPMSGSGQVISVSRPVPASATTWHVYSAAGAIGYDANHEYTTTELAALGAVASAGFTMGGLAAPAASVVTGLSIGTILHQKDKTSGWQYAELTGVSWTEPTDASTPAGHDSPWLIKFYARNTDAGGTPAPVTSTDTAGAWKEWTEKEVISPGGASRTSDPGPWPLGDAMAIAYRTDAYHYLQVQCVAVNRASTSPADWNGSNTSSSVAQGSVMQLDFGSLPAGGIPLNMYDAATQLPGVQVTNVPAPAVGSMTLSCPISNGATTPSGAITYCWDGTLSSLPTDPNYAGCEITVQYAGSAEGGAFAKLTAAQTTFHNGDWARPSSNIAVTFRAYPISRDGVRGTPATYSTTITAAASYVAPPLTAPSTTGMAMTLTIYDAPVNGLGQDTFYWAGSITPPSSLTNFDKVEMTQQWNFDPEGGTFATLQPNGSSAIPFRSGGNYARPMNNQTCVFRAYPVAKDGVRGTPVSVTSTIWPSRALTPNTTGTELIKEDWESGLVRDWNLIGTTGIWAIDASSPISGAYSLKSIGPHTTNTYLVKDFSCGPGASFAVQFKYKSSGASGSNLHVAVVYWDTWGGGNTVLANNDTPLAPSASPVTVTLGPYIAPAGTKDVRIQFYVFTGASGTYWLDDISFSIIGGTGMAVSNTTGLLTNTGQYQQTSAVHDWDFALSPLGQIRYNSPVWTATNGGGPDNYAVVMNDAVQGNFVRMTVLGGCMVSVSQRVALTYQQTVKFTCTFRTGNPGGGTPAFQVYCRWINAAGNIFGAGGSGAGGVIASWLSNQPFFTYAAPAGTVAAMFDLITVAMPDGDYIDITKIVLAVTGP